MKRGAAWAAALILAASAPASGAAAERALPEIVAHRGASLDAPENTLAAIREAWRQDADAVEVDVRLTSDGELACVHDKTTERTADRSVDVASSPMARLRELDAGSWFGDPFAEERIPTLSQALEATPSDRRIFIDAKGGPELADPIVATIRNAGIDVGRATVMAFDAELAGEVELAAKRAGMDLDVRWLTSFRRDDATHSVSPTLEDVLAVLEATGADGAAVADDPSVDRTFVERLRETGRTLSVWTVDDPAAAARLAELGVDAIITNAPGKVRTAVEKSAEAAPR